MLLASEHHAYISHTLLHTCSVFGLYGPYSFRTPVTAVNRKLTRMVVRCNYPIWVQPIPGLSGRALVGARTAKTTPISLVTN